MGPAGPESEERIFIQLAKLIRYLQYCSHNYSMDSSRRYDTGIVSGYTINPTTGALKAIAGSPFAVGNAPRSVVVGRRWPPRVEFPNNTLMTGAVADFRSFSQRPLF